MNKFLTLTKVLLKNGVGFRKVGKQRRNLSLLIIIVLLPIMISTTFLVMNLYDALKAVNLEGIILALLLSVTCIAMVLFGVFYVLSTYYFADDIAQLITMPINPHLILASKFVIVSTYQYLLEAVILLPGIIAFGIKLGNIVYWIYSLIIFLLLPVIPTVICSVISLLLMTFGKLFRNKDRVKFVAGFFSIAIVVGTNFVIQMFGTNFSSNSSTLINNSGIMKNVTILFPTNLIIVNSILNKSALLGLLFLALFIIISAAVFALFLLIGNGLYITGVVGLTQNAVSGKQLSSKQFVKYNKKQPKVFSLATKDWRILLRTPTYFLNCILSALIFPPIIILLFGFSTKGDLPSVYANPLIISIGVIILNFFCIINKVSSTAISRDGKNAFVSRYLPVSYHAQTFAKLLPGLALSGISIIVSTLLSFFVLKIEPFALISILILSIISITAFNMLGLFVDIVFPVLEWDDETVAVKRNLNVGIQMLIMFFILALFAFLVYVLKPRLYVGVMFLLFANLAILVASAALLFTKGVEIYSNVSNNRTGVAKSGKAKINKSRMVTIILVLAVVGLMIYEITLTPKVQISATSIKISAGFMESSSFDISQIKNVYLKDKMPSTSNRDGVGIGNILRGTFTIDGLGRGYIFTETGKGPFLFVILKNNSFDIFNFSNSSITLNLYNSISKYSGARKPLVIKTGK